MPVMDEGPIVMIYLEWECSVRNKNTTYTIHMAILRSSSPPPPMFSPASTLYTFIISACNFSFLFFPFLGNCKLFYFKKIKSY